MQNGQTLIFICKKRKIRQREREKKRVRDEKKTKKVNTHVTGRHQNKDFVF